MTHVWNGTTSQNWEVGERVNVGFNRDLEILAKLDAPYKLSPETTYEAGHSCYVLRSKAGTLYRCIGYQGLAKIEPAEAQFLTAQADSQHSERDSQERMIDTLRLIASAIEFNDPRDLDILRERITSTEPATIKAVWKSASAIRLLASQCASAWNVPERPADLTVPENYRARAEAVERAQAIRAASYD